MNHRQRTTGFSFSCRFFNRKKNLCFNWQLVIFVYSFTDFFVSFIDFLRTRTNFWIKSSARVIFIFSFQIKQFQISDKNSKICAAIIQIFIFAHRIFLSQKSNSPFRFDRQRKHSSCRVKSINFRSRVLFLMPARQNFYLSFECFFLFHIFFFIFSFEFFLFFSHF